MPVIAVAAALGASLSWAVGALVAHRPASLLGPFEMARVQLIAASVLLMAIVTLRGTWQSVDWSHWPSYVFASVIGVAVANVAMFACMRRGGPRRTQLLMAMNAPIAAVVGYALLGETLSGAKLFGAVVAFCGMILAIVFGGSSNHRFETIRGSLWALIALGLIAAASNAIGLVLLKPALLDGTDPLALNALRTLGGSLTISLVALWPAAAFAPQVSATPGLLLHTLMPAVLGFIIAVSLQLYALRALDAGVAVVLSSAAPVMLLPMIWAITGERPLLPAWLGASLALAGTGLILMG